MSCSVCHNFLLKEERWKEVKRMRQKYSFNEEMSRNIDVTSLLASMGNTCASCYVLRSALDFMLGDNWRSEPKQAKLEIHTTCDDGDDERMSVILYTGRLCMALKAPTSSKSFPWPIPIAPNSTRFNGIETAILKAKSWLQNCIRSHRNCRLFTDENLPPLPSRILDISPSDCEVRLISTNDKRGKYICLSHCWGSNPKWHFKTTTSTILENESGFSLGTLPPLFRDVILLARGIGVRYVWIDSICILQEDEDEFRREAPKMGQYYQNSLLTIAATGFRDAGVSFFPTSECHSITGISEKGKEFSVLLQQVKGIHRGGSDLRFTYLNRNDDPLMARGWVFQERLLSPRILHCRREEILWECISKRDCECGGGHIHPEDQRDTYQKELISSSRAQSIQRNLAWLGSASLFSLERIVLSGFGTRQVCNTAIQTHKIVKSLHWHHLALFFNPEVISYLFKSRSIIEDWFGSFSKNPDLWSWLVEEYTKLDLSKASDRLPAVLGVANQLQYITKDQYIAGLWVSKLAQCLCWTRDWGSEELKSGVIRPSQLETLAPTWSWGSVSGRCHYHSVALMYPSIRFSHVMLNVEVPRYENFPEDRQSLGSITIRGQFRFAKLKVAHNRVIGVGIELNTDIELSHNFQPDYSFWKDKDEMTQPLACITLANSAMRNLDLIVRPVDDGGQLYERVGLLEVYRDSWELLERLSAEEKTITVV